MGFVYLFIYGFLKLKASFAFLLFFFFWGVVMNDIEILMGFVGF